ncbi:hypothetical protein LIER_24542 [Lithospermum erythrorhizon]|uniref:Uncharacterized protein n=1 Tax=Lithospermum erythrorhizon TaxID=34254 RepID=A0AAV3R1K3_LITER
MGKFKVSLLKKWPQDLGEFNERAYKYIQIEETEKWAEKVRGKCQLEDNRQRSPEPKRRSALDRIRAPDKSHSRANFPRSSAFSCLHGDPRKLKEVREGKIEYLTPLSTSAENVFVEIEDKRMQPRPPWQKMPQNKKGMRKFYQYHKDDGHDIND